MDKPKIRILHNMARSGGTLVSRCIGSMRDIVVLSEIHPSGKRFFDPLEQAIDWHQLFGEHEIADLPSDFSGRIEAIERKCRDSDKTLLIRDWAHLDFIGVPFLPKASLHFQLDESLVDNFDLIKYALVRHPVDLWISISRLAVFQGKLSPQIFLEGYLEFAKQCQQIGFMRYEDFTNKPAVELRRLCNKLQLNFDKKFLTQWPQYTKVTGDITRQKNNANRTKIAPQPRPTLNISILNMFRNNPNYQNILELLGYPDLPEPK